MQGTDTVKFTKSPQLIWYGHVERMQSQQTVTATMEGTRKCGRPCNRWGNKAEEDLNIMGIKIRQAIVRDPREWRKIVLEAKIYNGL
jgi:hypothetical protein